MAILVQFQCHALPIVASESETERMGNGKYASEIDGTLFVIVKADAGELHRLKHWNEKLMLVPIVQVVEKTDKVIPIPSLVGFYGVQDELGQRFSNLLLFESHIQGAYKFIPRLLDWEDGPIAGVPAVRVEKQIERTPEIMERIANYECATVARKFRRVDLECDKINAITILLDRDMVEIRVQESLKDQLKLLDVLLGPLNLEP